jgi:hypothetical protein
VTARATYAGALALAVALGVLAISPAFAAAPNESFAALATGPISARPTGMASFPDHAPVTLPDTDIAGLLTTGSVTDTADAVAASATIRRPTATLTARTALTASSVSSSCGFDANTDIVNGSTTITDGLVDLPKAAIAIAPNPAPNTVLPGLNGIGTVTLNAQSTSAGGQLIVTAVQISLTGKSTQTLSLGVSTCNAADLEPVPILPGRFALAAAAAAFALAGTTFQLRSGRLPRRRRRINRIKRQCSPLTGSGEH